MADRTPLTDNEKARVYNEAGAYGHLTGDTKGGLDLTIDKNRAFHDSPEIGLLKAGTDAYSSNIINYQNEMAKWALNPDRKESEKPKENVSPEMQRARVLYETVQQSQKMRFDMFESGVNTATPEEIAKYVFGKKGLPKGSPQEIVDLFAQNDKQVKDLDSLGERAVGQTIGFYLQYKVGTKLAELRLRQFYENAVNNPE